MAEKLCNVKMSGEGGEINQFVALARSNATASWIFLIPSLLKDYKYVKLMTPQDWIDNGGDSSVASLITVTSATLTVDGVSTSLTTTPVLVSSLNIDTANDLSVYFAGSTSSFGACAVIFYN